jgi:hypothetical protein
MVIPRFVALCGERLNGGCSIRIKAEGAPDWNGGTTGDSAENTMWCRPEPAKLRANAGLNWIRDAATLSENAGGGLMSFEMQWIAHG